VVGSCKQGNEPYGFTKRREFLDQLKYYISFSRRTLFYAVSSNVGRGGGEQFILGISQVQT